MGIWCNKRVFGSIFTGTLEENIGSFFPVEQIHEFVHTTTDANIGSTIKPLIMLLCVKSIWDSFPRTEIWCSDFPFFDDMNSNGVIRIMTFKSLRKICWIDN